MDGRWLRYNLCNYRSEARTQTAPCQNLNDGCSLVSKVTYNAARGCRPPHRNPIITSPKTDAAEYKMSSEDDW